MGLCGGDATEVVPPKGTDASLEMSEKESYSAHTSIIGKREQEIVNIYHINANNLYGCPHVQPDIGEEKFMIAPNVVPDATFQARDKRIQEIIQIVEQKQKDASKNVMVQNDILYSKDSHKYSYWRPVLPTNLEISVIRYVHTSLGHLGTEKCIAQIANIFHVKGLGRKVRKFISLCDTCQQVIYTNRSCAVQNPSHLPTKPGDICAVDLYGPLPFGRFGFRYIFVCFDVFFEIC